MGHIFNPGRMKMHKLNRIKGLETGNVEFLIY